MKVVIQRVKSSNVTVNEKIISHIKNGLVVLVGLHEQDTQEKFDYFIKKIVNLRIFEDEQNKMNKSVLDYNYEILLVSQFTLYGDCKKGNRPSFINAMPPNKAKVLYQKFVDTFRKNYGKVYNGVFGAHMQVTLVNDGPVTIILEN